LCNGAEYVAGSDPTNAASMFALTLTGSNNAVIVYRIGHAADGTVMGRHAFTAWAHVAIWMPVPGFRSKGSRIDPGSTAL